MNFISTAVAQTTNTASLFSKDSMFGGMIPIILILAFMYFFVMRPQIKKQKQQQQMLTNLSKGDEVVTIGGIIGRISKVTDSYITLELNDQQEIKCQKIAVAHILPKGTIKEI
jgi:preprotein translocase subunit YajC